MKMDRKPASPTIPVFLCCLWDQKSPNSGLTCSLEAMPNSL